MTAIFCNIDLFEHVFRCQLEDVLEKCQIQNKLRVPILIFTEYEHSKIMKKLGAIWLQIFDRVIFHDFSEILLRQEKKGLTKLIFVLFFEF